MRSSSRSLCALLLTTALTLTACTSGGGAAPTDPEVGIAAPPSEVKGIDPADLTLTSPPALVFTSTDGSAFAGSTAVFTLTETSTGKTVTAVVDGTGASTRSELYPAPGTYAISVAERYVSPTGSFTVRDLSAGEVTVSAQDDPENPVTVTFGLDAQFSPFTLAVESTTPTSVELTGEVTSGVQIGAFTLRQTIGTVPATGPADGTEVTLADSTVPAASVTGLAPAQDYTFTLFAIAGDGAALASRSVTVTTPAADATGPSYALAPNTIVPADFAALAPQALGNSRVGITLAADNGTRVSATEIPGVPVETLTDGCVVGMPVLVSTEIAGDDAFYGLIESCGATPPSWRAPGTKESVTAVVNGDVPLAAVFPYLHVFDAQINRCFDSGGQKLPDGDPLCAGADTDGDGLKDTTAAALGFAVDDPADGWNAFAQARKPAGAVDQPAPDPIDVSFPEALTGGAVQVSLIWASGDDLDLAVAEPFGQTIDYRTTASAKGGTLDRDDQGGACGETTAHAENIVWPTTAPSGLYSVQVSNFSGVNRCSENVQARLEVRVGGVLVKTQVLTVGVDGPVTFPVFDTAPWNQSPSGAELSYPGTVPSGDLEIHLMWAAAADLELLVSDAGGILRGSSGNFSNGPWRSRGGSTSCSGPRRRPR